MLLQENEWGGNDTGEPGRSFQKRGGAGRRIFVMICGDDDDDDGDDDDQDDVAQVWTGDFNALTREDYTDAGWARVAEVPL